MSSLNSPPSLQSGRSRPRRGRRGLIATLALAAGAGLLVTNVPRVSAEDDPPHPPDTASPTAAPHRECDVTTGFPRPTGNIPPGYIYAPTTFDGTVADPQPDDTFAADAPGHAIHVGHLRTRVVNGQEQFLVCAHVGTNRPTNALTPFPVVGPGAHPATIAPRVVVIGVNGGVTRYKFGAAGTSSKLKHYAGSTDVRQGFMQMWVPFSSTTRDPGFTVRVEIRGKSTLPGGGTSLVMGADEVFVHLGGAPLPESGYVEQGVGVALDDGVIAERPDDPGADDVSSYFGPIALSLIEGAVEGLAPRPIDNGHLDSIEWWSPPPTLDIVDVTPTASHLQAQLGGVATIAGWGREFGITCHFQSGVRLDGTATFDLDLIADRTRPRIDLHELQISYQINFVQSPDCNKDKEDRIRGKIAAKLDEILPTLADTQQFRDALAQVNKHVGLADLTTGPFASGLVDLGGGLGFGFDLGRYVKTGPGGSLGDIGIWHEGADLAAESLVFDRGGTRFPYSAVPSSSAPVVTSTHRRARPNGQTFDIGVIVNGAAVNQLARALSAGVAQVSSDKGMLDLRTTVSGHVVDTHPAVPPQFLPAPRPGWPATGNFNLYVPTLRVSVPDFAEVATVAADLRVGLDAFVEDNHLVPYVQKAKVASRFLRLGTSINTMIDPALDPEHNPIFDHVATQLRQVVPAQLGNMLAAERLPDLSVLGGPPVFIRRLSVGTVDGGHLGLYADVDAFPGIPASPVTVTFAAGGPNGAPTTATAEVSTNAIPGLGHYTIEWTLLDAGSGDVLYQSPPGGESAMTKTVDASHLQINYIDPCTGLHYVHVGYAVKITKGGYTKTTASTVQYGYGTPPDPVPPECNEPEPEPEPDPEPPIPPMCRIKPWLCEPEPEQG